MKGLTLTCNKNWQFWILLIRIRSLPSDGLICNVNCALNKWRGVGWWRHRRETRPVAPTWGIGAPPKLHRRPRGRRWTRKGSSTPSPMSPMAWWNLAASSTCRSELLLNLVNQFIQAGIQCIQSKNAAIPNRIVFPPCFRWSTLRPRWKLWFPVPKTCKNRTTKCKTWTLTSQRRKSCWPNSNGVNWPTIYLYF